MVLETESVIVNDVYKSYINIEKQHNFQTGRNNIERLENVITKNDAIFTPSAYNRGGELSKLKFTWTYNGLDVYVDDKLNFVGTENNAEETLTKATGLIIFIDSDIYKTGSFKCVSSDE